MPLLKDGRVLGVLDLDSPELARFDGEDGAGLKASCTLLLARSELSGLCA